MHHDQSGGSVAVVNIAFLIFWYTSWSIAYCAMWQILNGSWQIVRGQQCIRYFFTHDRTWIATKIWHEGKSGSNLVCLMLGFRNIKPCSKPWHILVVLSDSVRILLVGGHSILVQDILLCSWWINARPYRYCRNKFVVF